jgi:hypothetical protein
LRFCGTNSIDTGCFLFADALRLLKFVERFDENGREKPDLRLELFATESGGAASFMSLGTRLLCGVDR